MRRLIKWGLILSISVVLSMAQDILCAKDLQKLYKETINTPEKIVKKYEKKKKIIVQQKVNNIFIMNKFYEKLQKSKYVDDFVFKIPKEIDLLVSSSIKVINNKYYVKQNMHWVKVMIYQKPEFK